MTHEDVFPNFDESDRSIFSIKDSRERADRLRDYVVPRLSRLSRVAMVRVGDVFEFRPLDKSSKTISPDHREDAATTKFFSKSYAGLVMRQIEGKYHYVKLKFELSKSGLIPVLETSRPIESKALFSVLRDYENEVLPILEDFDIALRLPETDSRLPRKEMIRSAVVSDDEPWWRSTLTGSLYRYPINCDESIGILVNQFIAMFPIYQATCERVYGVDDQFPEYHENYLRFRRSLDGKSRSLNAKPEDGNGQAPRRRGEEGELYESLRKHRRREHKLRDWKIDETLKTTERLRCEVPGCGFDFLEVYGELGRGFAHVHHLEALASRNKASGTKLSDLAIICPNCHAMIHRMMTRQGRSFVSLDELIPKSG